MRELFLGKIIDLILSVGIFLYSKHKKYCVGKRGRHNM